MGSGLGVMDYRTCSEASTNITSNRPKNYRKWSEKKRYENGKYAAIHGSRAAERKFHTKEKPLSENNAQRFSKLHKEEISKAQKNNRDVNRNLSVLPRGRPLLLGSLDQMVQRFLLSLQRAGGLSSSAIAISAAKALIARNPQYNLSHIDLDSENGFREWASKNECELRVKSRFQKVLGKRLNCYIFTTSSRLSRNTKSLVH